MRKILILPIALFCVSIAFSQDLIERTRANIAGQNDNQGSNEIAKFVKKKGLKNKENKELSIFDFSDQSTQKNHKNILSGAVYLNLKPEQLQSAWEGRMEHIGFNLPVSKSKSIKLELVKVNTFSNDFIAQTNNGVQIESNGMHYRGIVNGDNNSWAAISIYKNQVVGVIADKDGNYTLGHLEDSKKYTLYNDKKLLLPFNFSCELNATQSGSNIVKRDSPIEKSNQSASKCVKIHFELDYYSYLHSFSSDSQSATNFVTGMFNVVATLYQNESIPIELSGLKIWTTQDPYGGEINANCGAVLNNFSGNVGSFNGDLAHLITAIDPNGQYFLCGLANLGCSCDGAPCQDAAFCNSFVSSTAYSQSFNTYSSLPAYSWTVNIIAHELGHNFGSPHTHDCAWNGNNTAIDGCVPPDVTIGFEINSDTCRLVSFTCGDPGYPGQGEGTIMSYCHEVSGVGINFANGFGSQPGNLMRANFNAASCLSSCTSTGDLGDGVCRTSMIVGDSDVPGSTGVFRASTTIATDSATVVIQSGEDVSFKAGSSIVLKEGFQANEGALFLADIENCTVALRDQSESVLKSGLKINKDSNIFFSLHRMTKSESHGARLLVSLNDSTLIDIQVFDLKGELVKIKEYSKFKKDGIQTFVYEILNMNDGLYSVVTNVGGKTQTKKMLLLR